MWGVLDKRSIASYGKQIAAVQEVIPQLLALFESYDIHATFATVGMLFHSNYKALEATIPHSLPQYEQAAYSPYTHYIPEVATEIKNAHYHFAPELITQIKTKERHEISTHTYSHYYCLEAGQTSQAFEADLEAAIQVAKEQNIVLESIVFPRNQYSKAYLDVCQQKGIYIYRGNETSWLYAPRSREQESLVRRALRLIDAYINISGHHCADLRQMKQHGMVNIPASRFLRPYSAKLRLLDSLRLARIKRSMTYAAKKGRIYHLWWHPHNFGTHLVENMQFLEKILVHYQHLAQTYNFQSATMQTLGSRIKNK